MYIAFIFVIDIVHMSLSVKSIFVVVMPFILLVMIQRVILRASTSRNKEKKQMLRVMIVGIIPLIVCAVQLSMNEYTSNFNRDRWLNDEITQLLGTPTETRNEEEGVITLYYLGTERGFIPIDSEQLIFQFDRDGRVLTYKVQRG
ncbi:hypothetical protein L4B26_06250 [Bacillus toyonensis]|uniref:hypothetical protein n=1 Tax=Bacillus toyonensis TaxID=155322 RepID=UPI001F10B2B7|nr:hypothetical protein [Bacillus toyonensis]MCH5451544.1 hypothetical protein [Bacillus toyonensis]HDR7468710.1 hypothetical protein [Bacillus toyonensis]